MSKHIAFSVLLNCLIFKAVTDVFFICIFTNLNTNACDHKKVMLKICLSYLQLLIMNKSFVSVTCISHCQICFNKGCFNCC